MFMFVILCLSNSSTIVECAVGIQHYLLFLYCYNIHIQYKYTPLHVATYHGHYSVVRTLMEANADKDLLNMVCMYTHHSEYSSI